MKKLLIVAASFMFSNFSYAQFGGLINAATSAVGGGAGGGASSVTAEQIIKDYVAGSNQVILAQQRLLNAAKTNQSADTAKAALKSLSAGATTDSVDAANAVFTKDSKDVQSTYANENLVLDAQGKKEFAAGFLELAKGALAYGKVALEVKGFSPSVNAISSAGPALAVAKNIPSDMGNLKDTFMSVYAYAKSNDITPPKEAADVVKLLDGKSFN